MDKVIRRAATARKQAQAKAFRQQKTTELVDRQQVLRVRKDYNKALVTNLKESRKARWEDWQKGALAPMRHVGLDATSYGSVDVAMMHPPAIPKHLRRKAILFAEGDRVCVIRGRNKGQINEITQVNHESETVIVKDVNVADIHVPEWAKKSMNIQSDTMPQPLPISIDNVRHVIALDVNNTTKDHIVQHAYAAGPYMERSSDSKLPRFSRYVSGLDIEIPWPTEPEPQFDVGEFDTRGNEVSKVSWIPSLDAPPFPSTVIDELRNKFSRFRTRHDEEYVKKMVMEEYRQEYLKSQTLLTPKGEIKQAKALRSAATKAQALDSNGNVKMEKATAKFIDDFMKMQLNQAQPVSDKAPKASKARQTRKTRKTPEAQVTA
ncbi:uncharacterized protein N7483_001885 [Penicillium malachiteum]|uniref:uncharacterized protein n=1 Tax=Penicillium malachiteum TaxID=1324776 RepID=UPI002548A091|nr:uncharacterized protein N7483_001885 [Penicillium malachiteum]KAJ5736760.1 hypothetical protein N7483_001885 [Penicillium malachiteum]